MTQAITASRNGATFQARLFWRHAARLLDPHGVVAKVGFEQGPKSFDDIWVEYDSAQRPNDQDGMPLRREHYQCKWHAAPDVYGYQQLVDPAFINANARSLLERARTAQMEHAPDGNGVRFKLVTNWQIAKDDPLRPLISTRSTALRVADLFATKTDNSAAGRVRKIWREHLKIDDPELRRFARTLAFGQAVDSLDDLRLVLDETFMAMGLRRVPANESAFFYDDLIYQWMGQNRLEFDRTSFRAACAQEGILATSEPPAKIYGVKSFEHPIDRLEERCEMVLDFVPAFDARYIRSERDWSDKIYPDLRAFLLAAAAQGDSLRLALDAHTSVAFAAGAVLNLKSGRAIELEQRVLKRMLWSANDQTLDPAWPQFSFETVDIDSDRPDLAVAIGVTHDVRNQVAAHVRSALPSVGRILNAIPVGGPGARVVVCGRHAFDLAEAVAHRIAALRSSRAPGLNHLFMAVPNALSVFLGQRQPAIGPTLLYEFDFEGLQGGGYKASLALPVQHPATALPVG
jgi:hypothetical protein